LPHRSTWHPAFPTTSFLAGSPVSDRHEIACADTVTAGEMDEGEQDTPTRGIAFVGDLVQFTLPS